MGIFKSIGRIFRGHKADAQEALYKNEAYWTGLEKELDESVEKVNAKYRKASAVLSVKNENLAKWKKLEAQMKATANECKERFKEGQSESDKINAMNAFNKMNEYKAKVDILESEIAEVQKLVDQLAKMKANAVSIATTKKNEIAKAKSRVEFSDTMKDLTSGIKEFSTMELEGADVVDMEYHENVANLDELTANIVVPTTSDNSFDDFMNM
ncbi:MAG: hypothetical protein ACRCX2_13115 [Paraclostridium sp.]